MLILGEAASEIFFAARHASISASTAPGTCIIESSPKIVSPWILDDMQKGENSGTVQVFMHNT